MTEERSREVRVARSNEEEEDHLARSFHITFLSGKLQQEVHWYNDRDGGGLLPWYVCMKTGRPVADVLQEKHPNIHVIPVGNPTCAAFEEYEEVPERFTLDFSEDDVMWVSSKLSVITGALVAEAINLRNWLLLFGCVSEELSVVVTDMSDWMANSSPHWDAYRALMACCLVVLNKRPGVLTVGIGWTLCHAITKLVMRKPGDQARTECESLQLCTGIEAGVEGVTHAVS